MSHSTLGEPVLKEKQYSACAFLASTPAVSPSQRLVSGTGSINPQLVHLVRSDQDLSPFGPVSDGTVYQHPRHRINSTGSSETNETPLLTDGCFSPIDRMGGDNLIQTMNFSANETVTESCRGKSGRNARIAKRHPYPFPTPPCMKKFSWNKYESLLESLNILKCFNSFNKDNNAFNTVERKEHCNSARSNKRVEVKPKEKGEFVFTKEMFVSNNSEAFIQVTHFLFDLLDKTESANKFRDSWPIYERKQEALYRRKALEWFKEIISENPAYFSKSVRLEQLQGLIVNPYGDRFIRFLHSFVDFVMFRVTQIEEAEDPILQKPVFCGKPEITKRQGLIVGARIRNLAKLARSEQEKCVHEKLLSRKTLEKMERMNEEAQSALTLKQNTITKLVKSNPKYFPEDVNELLANQAEFFRNTFKKIPFGDLWMAIEKIDSPLNEYVNEIWRNALDTFGKKIDTVLDFVLRYSRLWMFLKASPQKSAQLELSCLYLPWEFQDIHMPSINDVLKSYARIISDCFNKLDSLSIPRELLSQKKYLDSKLNMMRQKCDDINKIEGPNIVSLKAQIDFEIKALSFELENNNWAKFSTLDDQPLSSMFDFSPARIVDTNKTTGFTPALSSYLPSSGEVSFSEANKNSWTHHNVNSSQFRNEDEADGGKQRVKSSSGLTNLNPLDSSAMKFQTGRNDAIEGQDTCNSPISHLPPKSSVDRSVMLQSRNVNRRRSSNKCKLSLPIVEDTEPTEDSVPVSTMKDISDENKNSNVETQNESTVEQRLSALLQSFTANLQQPVETSVVSRRGSRRNSIKIKSDETSNVNQSKCVEDLEEKLGILDITLSYANFLDLSQESCVSDNELEL